MTCLSLCMSSCCCYSRNVHRPRTQYEQRPYSIRPTAIFNRTVASLLYTRNHHSISCCSDYRTKYSIIRIPFLSTNIQRNELNRAALDSRRCQLFNEYLLVHLTAHHMKLRPYLSLQHFPWIVLDFCGSTVYSENQSAGRGFLPFSIHSK